MDRYRDKDFWGALSEKDLEDILNEEPIPESAEGAAAVDPEAEDFDKKWEEHRLNTAVQAGAERKIYAKRIFWLVAVWLVLIIALLMLEGFLGPRNCFELSDAVLIAVATTTTASVTALLVIVARYLFPPR